MRPVDEDFHIALRAVTSGNTQSEAAAWSDWRHRGDALQQTLAVGLQAPTP
ncbi:MAG TPA: hypothetical protein VKG63_01745 [Steroidobacteraceae bacterium]|jgi:hypothetical protein|nr:hypothetical protein [Steroidobacteraceae bacterium]